MTVRRNRKLKQLGCKGIDWDSSLDINDLTGRFREKEYGKQLADEQLDAAEYRQYENCWCSKPYCIGCTDADTCYGPDNGMHECNNCWWIEYQLDNGLLDPLPETDD